MFAGLAGTVGAAYLAEIASASPRIDSGEYMFAPGLTYLNTGSLGPTPRSVLDVVIKAWREIEQNPVGTTYGTGPVNKAADGVRERLAALISCTADELLLTRSTTDAMNAAALGIDLNRGDRVLTTDLEHHGGSNGWQFLKRKRGIEIDIVSIAVDDFDVKRIVERFEKAITPATKVISFSHVITSNGLRMPAKEIAAIARKKGIICVVDGAQAFGSTVVNVKDLGCDAYAAPGHKWMMAPKGTGFLYINKESASRIQPVEREDGLRFVSESAGMGPLPLVIGLGAAIDAAAKRGVAAIEEQNLRLRNRAYDGLKKIPKVQILSPPPGPLATAMVAFRLPDAADSIAFRSAMRDKHNLVLKQAEKRWFNGMRISPHIFNSEFDIDKAIDAIGKELL